MLRNLLIRSMLLLHLVEPSGVIEKLCGLAARRPDQKPFVVPKPVVAKTRRDLAINGKPCIDISVMVK